LQCCRMAKVKDSSWLNSILMVLILHLTATRLFHFLSTTLSGLHYPSRHGQLLMTDTSLGQEDMDNKYSFSLVTLYG
jgi:hypothetical protein